MRSAAACTLAVALSALVAACAADHRPAAGSSSPGEPTVTMPQSSAPPWPALSGLEMTPLLRDLGVVDPSVATARQVFAMGFESDGEWGASYVTPQSATTRHERWQQVVHSGEWAHTGWLTGEESTEPERDGPNHRGYPTLQFDRIGAGACASPCVVDLWVWLDANLGPGQWFSLATLSLDPSDRWSRVITVNVGVEGWLHLGHVPVTGAAERAYQTDAPFPMRQWVRVTTYLDARPGGVAVVWQDGVVASAARLDGVAGGLVPQAHFGLYAPPDLLAGRVVDDDLTVWTLAGA
ncbi:MAG: hypothetical protein Q7V57_15385 [Actinomycetota bacterium]|nr:hypothetical protein [Actinomycetota bacterium]